MTAKSDRVQKLIDDPDLTEAFEVVRQRYRDLIEETPVSDDGALLDIRKMLYLLKEVKEALHTALQQGHLEDFRAREQEGNGFLRDLRWTNRKGLLKR
jgi:hypothetical protein